MVDEPDPFLPEAQAMEDALEEKQTEQAEDEIRNGIERLQNAYRRVFEKGTPSQDDRAMVMRDLEIFTRGERTPWHEDERVHCVLTGRHEVYNRIRNFTRLPLDVLFVEAMTPKGK